jgi:hypothetical protein
LRRTAPATSALSSCRRGDEVRPAEQAPADEEDRVGRILGQPARQPRRVDPAGDHGERRPQAAQRCEQVPLNRPAVAERERESPAGIGVDHGVAAGDPEEVAEQQLGRQPLTRRDEAAGKRRVAEERHARGGGERAHRVESEQQRRDHRRAHAGVAQIVEALAEPIDRAGEIRHVEAAPAGLPVGARDMFGDRQHALAEGRCAADRRANGRP